MAESPDTGANKNKICFDYSHNNKLQLEDTPFNYLMDYLAESGFLLAKSELGFINQQYLQQFNCLVIGNAYESYFELEEIENIVNFVKEGGGLLLISDQGGDYDNRNNISELGSQFGIYFNADRLYDPVNFVDKDDFIIVKEFRQHFITRGVTRIIHSSGCSLALDEEQTSADTVVDGVAYASDTCQHHSYNGIDWVEEPAPGAVIVAAAKYFKGKVIAIGNLSMFSSLGASYGLKVEDNKLLVGNMFAWLLNRAPASGESMEHQLVVSVKLEESNYNWAMDQIKQKNWPSLSMMLNFSLRTLRAATQQKIETKPRAPAPELAKTEEVKTADKEGVPAPPITQVPEPEIVTSVPIEVKVDEQPKETKVPIETDLTLTEQVTDQSGTEKEPELEKKESETKPVKIPAKAHVHQQRPAKKFVRKPIKKPPPSRHSSSKPRRNPLS